MSLVCGVTALLFLFISFSWLEYGSFTIGILFLTLRACVIDHLVRPNGLRYLRWAETAEPSQPEEG